MASLSEEENNKERMASVSEGKYRPEYGRFLLMKMILEIKKKEKKKKSNSDRKKKEKAKLDDDKKKKEKTESDGDKKKKSKLERRIPYCSFTSLEKEEYLNRLEKSGGFDVGNIPDNIWPTEAHIRPIRFDKSPCLNEVLKMVESYSELALDKYNKDEKKTGYLFVKFLKANYSRPCRKEYYFITFEAKDSCSECSLPKKFQALVSVHQLNDEGVDEPTVEFCRPEPIGF